EFINAHFLRYYQENKITFTRSRPFKKNDNCYVEQKNYSFFQPYAKLIFRERVGGKVKIN
ncbi:MAG: transposase, partial [Dictyoglomus turgidum]